MRPSESYVAGVCMELFLWFSTYPLSGLFLLSHPLLLQYSNAEKESLHMWAVRLRLLAVRFMRTGLPKNFRFGIGFAGASSRPNKTNASDMPEWKLFIYRLRPRKFCDCDMTTGCFANSLAHSRTIGLPGWVCENVHSAVNTKHANDISQSTKIIIKRLDFAIWFMVYDSDWECA